MGLVKDGLDELGVSESRIEDSDQKREETEVG